ncbi:hypothetical protein ABIF50_010291 [Bradyrhizobium diazoefficiens]
MSEISPCEPFRVRTRSGGYLPCRAAGSHPAPVEIKPESQKARKPEISILYQLLIDVLADPHRLEGAFFRKGMSEKCRIVRTDDLAVDRNLHHISDMLDQPTTDLRPRLIARIDATPTEVWTPGDFADLGSRAAVDKTLQRLVAAGELRRIDRGLYDRPRKSNLTGKPMVPDYRAVIRAAARRDQARVVVDGMTAANDLGLTTAVPARIEVLVDARLKPITLGKQVIHFKSAAPSRLYWAGRPGMRVVQALYWMQDMMTGKEDRQAVENVLSKLFANPQHGKEIRDDLRAGLSAMPIWMQDFLRPLLESDDAAEDHS